MKAYMNHLRDKVSEDKEDLYHALFSDVLLGYTMKSDSAWAVEKLDDVLFCENKIND